MNGVIKSEKTEAASFSNKEKNYHSNSIIDSRQEFSMLEKKMIYCVINQLDISTENVQRDLFNDICFKIPVSTFGEDYSFHALKSAIKKITNRSISGGDNKKQHAFSLNPFPFAEVKNGMVELIMYSKAVPYFIDLKARGYTSYQLNIALTLKSVYSQRLYELLSRYKDTGKWYVEIDRFKFLLGIDKEKTFMGNLANGNLKSKVIEPAMKELAEKTEIEFNYSFQKTGKKYTAIAFDIYTQKLIKHIETADAKADAVEVLEQLAEARPGQQMAYLHIALSRYEFTDAQRQKIIKSNPVTVKFLHIGGNYSNGIFSPTLA